MHGVTTQRDDIIFRAVKMQNFTHRFFSDNPIILDTKAEKRDFDPPIVYLCKNFHSEAHYAFISAYYYYLLDKNNCFLRR